MAEPKVRRRRSALRAGDVVRLKSGGPPMTVQRLSDTDGEHDRVWCDWIDLEHRKHSAEFVRESLVFEEIPL